MENINNKNIVLEEMRRGFDKLWLASDVLDNKLQNILTFLSIIVSIGASVEASAFKDDAGVTFWALLVLAFLLYLIAFAVIMYGLDPYKYHLPFSSNWEEIFNRYFSPPETEVLDLFVMEHTRAMDKIAIGNQPKVNAIRVSSYLMVGVILVLMAAVPLGIIFPNPTLFCFFNATSSVC